MSKLTRYGQNKLIIGMISLLSVGMLTSAPFEKNPQDCEMINVPGKRKKQTVMADEGQAGLPDHKALK